MKEFRDNNFNEKQIKGLDMVMRALAKQYKFVKGWQLDTRYEEYMYTLYIDLFIDINDLAEQTNNYINKNRVGEKKGSSIFFALTPNKNGEPLEGFTPEWDQFVNDSYEYGKLNKTLQLKADKKIGFAIAYCDNDKSENRENFIGSVVVEGDDKNRGWIDADIFGTIELKE